MVHGVCLIHDKYQPTENKIPLLECCCNFISDVTYRVNNIMKLIHTCSLLRQEKENFNLQSMFQRQLLQI